MDINRLTWDDWQEIPDETKEEILAGANPYAGDGHDLLEQIVNEFMQTYGHEEGILRAGLGIHHGRYVIGLSVNTASNLSLPETYQGVQVLCLFTRASRDMIEKLGDAFDELGELVDAHYESIMGELASLHLSVREATREQLIAIIRKVAALS